MKKEEIVKHLGNFIARIPTYPSNGTVVPTHKDISVKRKEYLALREALVMLRPRMARSPGITHAVEFAENFLFRIWIDRKNESPIRQSLAITIREYEAIRQVKCAVGDEKAWW